MMGYDVLADAEAVALAADRRLAASWRPSLRRHGRFDLLASLLLWGGLAALFTLALAFLVAAVWLAEMAVRIMLG